jgi:hypothetical protein
VGASSKDTSGKRTQVPRLCLSKPVLLMCIVDANENRDAAIVDIPNAFVQMVVKDEIDKALICICGPLVVILVSICTQCKWTICYDCKERQEANASCSMFDCLVQYYGGSNIILQEVCQELEFLGFQA